MRPVFLSRITRAPSLRWALRKFAGRVLRQVRGIEREPVKPLSESQWQALESRQGILIGCLAASIVCIALLLIYRGSSC